MPVDAYKRFALLRHVIVNLDDGTAFAGVLYRQAGPLIVLKNASLLEPGREPVALDGDTLIERARVQFIQAP